MLVISPKPLTKLYKPRAYKRQFTVVYYNIYLRVWRKTKCFPDNCWFFRGIMNHRYYSVTTVDAFHNHMMPISFVFFVDDMVSWFKLVKSLKPFSRILKYSPKTICNHTLLRHSVTRLIPTRTKYIIKQIRVVLSAQSAKYSSSLWWQKWKFQLHLHWETLPKS